MPTLITTEEEAVLTTDDGVPIAIALGAIVARVAAPPPPGADAYTAQTLALLPPGDAWLAPPGSLMAALMEAYATVPARVHQRSADLLEELDPRTTAEMLADWEREVGLPDPCVGAGGSLVERRAALVARLTLLGGQSITFLTGLAAALGYQIEIEEHRPWRVGESSVAEPLNGPGWAYRITVHAPETTITSEWTVGQSSVADPLRTWGNVRLECVIRRAAPAHVVVRFAYDLLEA